MGLEPKTVQLAVLAVLVAVCLHSALAQTQYCLDKYRFPCVNGVCRTIPGSRSGREECRCSSGYTGTSCNIPINPCSVEPCLNDGNCTVRRNATGNNYGRYTCDCPDGYAGDACEIDIELACENIQCPDNSECQYGERETYERHDDSTGPDFYCACLPGYIQASSYEDYSRCLPIDPCLSNPCLNNGNCTTLSNGTATFRNRFVKGSYLCSCPGNFTGRNCQSSTDACASNPCTRPNTVCENTGNGKYRCVCDRDHYGPRCTKSINPCFENPCENDGECVVIRNGTSPRGPKYECDCLPGFNGRDCDLNMNQECERYGVHCKGDRVCIYSPKGRDAPRHRDREEEEEEELEQPSGEEDPEDPEDPVDPEPERRKRDAGEVTTNLHGCRSCQKKKQDYELYDHFKWAKSKKKVKREDFYCACPDGYFPSSTREKDSKCVPLDPCDERNRCKNGGICFTLQNGTYVEGTFRQGLYRCDCSTTGYTGPDCEISVNPCMSNPCARENKVCKVKRNGGYRCECAAGTFGTGCTLKHVNPCTLDDNKCSEDSQCINKGNATLTLSDRLIEPGKYVCRCDRDYLGKYCQYKECVDRYVARRCTDNQVCVVINDESRCVDKRVVGETNYGRSSSRGSSSRGSSRRGGSYQDEEDEYEEEE